MDGGRRGIHNNAAHKEGRERESESTGERDEGLEVMILQG